MSFSEPLRPASVSKPLVLVFAGSNRVASVNRRLAEATAAILQTVGFQPNFTDLRNFPMPLYDGDDETIGTPESVIAFQNLVRSHDALVIASPEYNGSFSALIKNTLDWISRPAPGERPLAVFQGKKAAILSASTGRSGGQRGLRHLRELLEMIGLQVVPTQVSVARAGEAFASDGSLVREDDRACIHRLARDLYRALSQQSGVQP